jgi:Domain of unknown function (DUF4279)
MLEDDEKWAAVPLRLFGDSLPLDEVGVRLDLAPHRVGKKGERRGGNPRHAKYETSAWSWSLASDRAPLEDQLAAALNILEPRRERLMTLIRETGATADLFIGFSSGNGLGGARFSPELLERLAKFGLPLEFDLFPPDVDESDG